MSYEDDVVDIEWNFRSDSIENIEENDIHETQLSANDDHHHQVESIDESIPNKNDANQKEFNDLSTRFTNDKIFDSRQELIDWAKETGKEVGTVIVTKKSDRVDSGRTPRIFLACERGGKYKPRIRKIVPENRRRKSGTKLCECPFMLKGVYIANSQDKWKVKVVCGRHNHPLLKYLEGHSYAGRLTVEERRVVEEMSRSGVKPKQALSVIKARDSKNASTIQHVYNARISMRHKEMEGRTQMQQLMKELREKNYIEWSRRHDAEGTEVVKDLFWAHPDSVQLARCFPHVFLMDATYKTNKFKWPLFEIVGVTSTQKTFSVCFAFMEEEKEPNYIWVLQKFHSLLNCDELPSIIVTDRELALINGLHKIFPSTKLLLCRWHISKNVLARSKKAMSDIDIFKKFMESWSNLVMVETEDEYEQHLRNLEHDFSDWQILLNYVKETWLTPYKDRFVAAWIDHHMHLGNTTTNRVEGAHARLKKRLSSCKYDFLGMWKVMHPLVIEQMTEIKASFEVSMTRVQHEHRVTFLKEVRGFVSISAMDLLLEEKQRGENIGIDFQLCKCVLRRTHGLPCAHALNGYEREGRVVPLSSIHSFWKKLSAIPPINATHTDDFDFRPEFQAFSKGFKESTEEQKVHLLKRLKELVAPETSWLSEPKEQVKTRGRPKGAKNIKEWQAETSTTRDPSYFEYVCATTPVVVSSQPSALSIKSAPTASKKKSVTRKVMSISKFPAFIQPLIENIIDVPGDGHCGFRSVGKSLGMKGEDTWKQVRMDLYSELMFNKSTYLHLFGGESSFKEMEKILNCSNAPCGPDYWMLMPETGHLIASRYDVVLVYISPLCLTFLPLKSPPKPTKLIAIGYFHKEYHFVSLVLKPNSPIPRVATLWSKYANEQAKEWTAPFEQRMNDFDIINGGNVATREVFEIDD